MPLLSGIYDRTPLNSSEISQASLNIEDKYRSNPFTWSGQFSPQLIQVLLSQYTTSDSVILDPFLGSGTVLLEAGRVGLTAFGTEINPAATTLAKTYHFINVPTEERRMCIDNLDEQLHEMLPDPLPLFRSPEQNIDSEAIKMKLVDLTEAGNHSLQQILITTLIVMLDFHKPGLSPNKVFEWWNKLTALVLKFPFSERPIAAFHADARCIPLHDSSVNLVVTSPPYINVFNYHQQYRTSMEALHWDLLQVAKSEFGSNRKHRGNRFLTVIQFCLDIAQTLKELARLCQADARLIFVVGRESTVRGTAFYNGEIVAEVAHSALGFDLTLRQERVFLNRYGQNIYEDILHFLPTQYVATDLMLDGARAVAQQALETVFEVAPKDAKEDINSALDNIESVSPSPLFQIPKAYEAAHVGGQNV